MTSEKNPSEAYVWIWLPGQTKPVIAGRLSVDAGVMSFNYGRSYLGLQDAIPVYLPELPLQPGLLSPLQGLTMPGSIRDAAPDAWGRRVILNRELGRKGREADTADLSELVYLLESGSDRTGALDFQSSPQEYRARASAASSLSDLLKAADAVEEGTPLPAELDQALLHGSSIGGARPKAMITSDDRKFIAKFSSKSDVYSVVKAEFIAMRLAAIAGITAAPVRLEKVIDRDVLLIERFDRERTNGGWLRKPMVSALTLFELDELMARYASYTDLAEIIRTRFDEPKKALREMFARLVFNVLCGNTDDHARNHAAFWSGSSLSLTPAYDICPQARSGREATQAMIIADDRRDSRLATCLDAAPNFLLKPEQAIEITEKQILAVRENWDSVCIEANLSRTDRARLRGGQFLNPYAFEGAPERLAALAPQ